MEQLISWSILNEFHVEFVFAPQHMAYYANNARYLFGSQSIVQLTRDSVVLHFDKLPSADQLNSFVELNKIDHPENSTKQTTKKFELPVCYEDDFGRDMEQLESKLRLTRKEIIKMHSAAEYEVCMFGFMPGFPYLSGLPAPLHIKRKSKPDKKVPAGSVAIAADMTGIYPSDSPGGWHIIGRTPITMFTVGQSEPCPLSVGMNVSIRQISVEEFRDLNGNDS